MTGRTTDPNARNSSTNITITTNPAAQGSRLPSEAQQILELGRVTSDEHLCTGWRRDAPDGVNQLPAGLRQRRAGVADRQLGGVTVGRDHLGAVRARQFGEPLGVGLDRRPGRARDHHVNRLPATA
ncbi:MAG: hypothetical protein WKF73_08130 [Nocardioidaceae bacterium]